MNKAWTVFIFKLLILVSCFNSTDKKNVEKVNDERFENKEESRQAQFLVDIIDRSYGILEVAQLGEEKIDDPLLKQRAKDIIENQTSIGLRFKTFAEQNDVSIPLSGPEKTKGRVKDLYDKTGTDFSESWMRQLKNMHHEFADKVEDFREGTEGDVKASLDSTIMMIKENEEAILAFDESEEKNQN